MSQGRRARGRGAAHAAGGVAAATFAALGDETRLAIVSRLCMDGPLSTARLAEGAVVTRQAIAKHLVVLADAGLVVREDHGAGRERRWEIEPRRLDEALERLREVVER